MHFTLLIYHCNIIGKYELHPIFIRSICRKIVFYTIYIVFHTIPLYDLLCLFCQKDCIFYDLDCLFWYFIRSTLYFHDLDCLFCRKIVFFLLDCIFFVFSCLFLSFFVRKIVFIWKIFCMEIVWKSHGDRMEIVFFLS